MPKKNIPLLLKNLEQVEKAAKVGLWFQGDYVCTTEELNLDFPDEGYPACGTAYCYAGWLPATLGREYAGLDPDGVDFQYIRIAEGDVPARKRVEDENGSWAYTADNHALYRDTEPGETVHVSSWAEAQLGLTNQESQLLFEGSNTLDDLRAIILSWIDSEES